MFLMQLLMFQGLLNMDDIVVSFNIASSNLNFIPIMPPKTEIQPIMAIQCPDIVNKDSYPSMLLNQQKISDALFFSPSNSQDDDAS